MKQAGLSLAVVFRLTLFLISVLGSPGDVTTETHASKLSDTSTAHDLLEENVSNANTVRTVEKTTPSSPSDSTPDYVGLCPSNVECSLLGGECIDCDFDDSCTYGHMTNVTCQPKPHIVCLGGQSFNRTYECRYCFMTPVWQHTCDKTGTSCRVSSAYQNKYETNCSVMSNVLCHGRRSFRKMVDCNWTSGKRWSTALALSITLGGFGADRFYLGLWKEGIGKLFSFGGLGVWTLVDVILIATGYVGPADGSLYIF